MYQALLSFLAGEAAKNPGSAKSLGRKNNYFDQLMGALNQPTYSQKVMPATSLTGSNDMGGIMGLMNVLKGGGVPQSPLPEFYKGFNPNDIPYNKPWEDYG